MSVTVDIEGSSQSPLHSASRSTPSRSSSQSPLHSASLSTDSCLHFLMTESPEHDGTPDQQMGPDIPRVPPVFREMKENTGCYEPKVVSIGPYHHGEKELEKMQTLKTKIARQLAKDSREVAEEMYNKVKDLVSYARECYAEESTRQFNDEKFTQVMFLDGYFILQFLTDKLEKQKLRNEEVDSVTRDLLLLENQLPFDVLIALMRIHERKGDHIAGEDKSSSPQPSSESEDQDLMKIIEQFFNAILAIPPQRESCLEKISNSFSELPRKLRSITSKSPGSKSMFIGFDHLLDFFYWKFVYGEGQRELQRRRYRETTSWNRYYSVNELKNVGISFKPSNTSVFTDVKFKQTPLGGALLIPPLSIEEETKSLLLNLAAYETCAGWYSDHKCTSYVCFMRSLIDKPEDVKELRSQGILRTTIGSDDQIAQIFREITTNLASSPYAYNDVKSSVELHYRSTVKRWILQYKDPFYKKVAKYSFIYGIAVSAIQAYLAETKEKPGFGNCSCSNATLQHP